jgi:glycosyltransferase involved in cell wall biosynthesis
VKVLFVSNFYPPQGHGGYEAWCAEMAAGLRGRGHAVTVLTSGRPDPTEPAWIRRELLLEMRFTPRVAALDFFLRRQARERHNLARVRQACAALQPDRVVIWGMWNLPRSLPALAEQLCPERVVYYFGDYWPTLPSQYVPYWEAPPRSGLNALPKRLLRPFALRRLRAERPPVLQMRRALFPTRFLREEYARLNVPLQATALVPGGIDLTPYRELPSRPLPNGALRLLTVGRISPEKGLATAIEALAQLAAQGLTAVTLQMVGGGETGYTAELQALAARLGVAARVEFVGAVAPAVLPRHYTGADVFIFPSVWSEPFGRVVVEALAAGLPVVGTGTGGSGEILAAVGEPLLFPPGDSAVLAEHLLRLAHRPELISQQRAAGRRAAAQFSLPAMLDGLAAYLEALP